ncbi:TetR/AcrR family transcriptional regulator [Furfurilactobacillus sp. WILCCON 0119]
MTKTRRRGAELDAAIYEATRSILENEGLAQLTFAKVAAAAGTSKPVIYRHWQSPFELALLAVQDKIKADNNGRLDELELTGTSLSADLFETFKRFTFSTDAFGKSFVLSFNGLNDEQNKQLQVMINEAKQIDINAIDHVVARAQARHELATGKLDDALKLMPFEWLRYRIFMNETITDEDLTKLIDGMLVPAYRQALAK